MIIRRNKMISTENTFFLNQFTYITYKSLSTISMEFVFIVILSLLRYDNENSTSVGLNSLETNEPQPIFGVSFFKAQSNLPFSIEYIKC